VRLSETLRSGVLLPCAAHSYCMICSYFGNWDTGVSGCALAAGRQGAINGKFMNLIQMLRISNEILTWILSNLFGAVRLVLHCPFLLRDDSREASGALVESCLLNVRGLL